MKLLPWKSMPTKTLYQMQILCLFPLTKKMVDICKGPALSLTGKSWSSNKQATSQSTSSVQGHSLSMKDLGTNKTTS